MAEEVPAYVLETKKLLEQIISKPKLTEKLLSKPPFKFLHDVVSNTLKATSFSSDFTPEDLDVDKIQDAGKEAKIAFLEKLISVVGNKLGEPVAAKPSKIIAGAEAENTNLLLQQLARAASKPAETEAPKKKKKVVKEEAEPTPSDDAAPKKKKKVVKKDAADEQQPAEEAKPKKKAVKKTADEDGAPKKKKKATTEEPPAEEGKKKKKVASKGEDGDAPKKKKKPAEGSEAEAKPKKKKSSEKAEGSLQVEVKQEAPLQSRRPEPTANFSADSSRDIAEEPKVDLLAMQQANSGRPQSARPAPPRIQSNVKAVEQVKVENVIPITNSTILKETEEEDEMDLGEGLDDEEEQAPASQNVDISSISEDQQQYGGLVRDIIAADKAHQQNDGQPVKREQVKVEVLANKHQREVLQKEVGKLRESIQVVCRSANPLGKTMEYLQEDFENMNKELEKWRLESANQSTKLQEERRTTESLLQPLNTRLSDLDRQIAETMQKIHLTKTTVAKNDDNITKMLSLVVN